MGPALPDDGGMPRTELGADGGFPPELRQHSIGADGYTPGGRREGAGGGSGPQDGEDALVEEIKAQRTKEAQSYASGIMAHVAFLLLLLLVSLVQVGAYFAVLPSDPQICYLNSMNNRWFCESAEGSYGLKHQFKLSTANKDSLCGWYAVFTIVLDLTVVLFAMSIPNCFVREYSPESLTDRHHGELLLVVGRSVLTFGAVTHLVLIGVFQVLFDGIMHSYKPLQGVTMATILVVYFAFSAGIAVHMLAAIVHSIQASRAAEAGSRQQRGERAAFGNLGLSAVELAALQGASS